MRTQRSFYNPAMSFNRSLSTLAVKALAPERVLDGFCASGARGLRYAAEGGAGGLVFLDLSSAALSAAKANARLNKTKAEFVRDDFNHYCHSGRRFDFVEADPFGSPAPFIAAALDAFEKKGALSVTATDLANLCASTRQRTAVCVRQYQAVPMRCDFTHEVALRLLLGKVCREAAARDYAMKPLLCWYERHYAKAIVSLGRSAAGADASLKMQGFVSFNPKTLDRRAGAVKGWRVAGPLWLGDCCDSAFVKQLETLAVEAREKKFLGLLAGEIGLPPFYWDVHALSEHWRIGSPRTEAVIEGLRKRGFRAVGTHYAGTGVKTDAPLAKIKGVFKWALKRK
ncbi:hypothetical protein AUJ16_00085 [Candidatus Micrarchaeota archaeon CG1_02_60_51]|nr:MAG: hypothetical protein AUJ16_00085 [Candidatus Micrarchaeota archaeon CG1_02_60_51]